MSQAKLKESGNLRIVNYKIAILIDRIDDLLSLEPGSNIDRVVRAKGSIVRVRVKESLRNPLDVLLWVWLSVHDIFQGRLFGKVLWIRFVDVNHLLQEGSGPLGIADYIIRPVE